VVFEQNTGARPVMPAGTLVDLHWASAHSFLLDAAQDSAAGVELESDAAPAGVGS
jgi:spermidine/putrescine transport system ATP-binding protein